jgi:hypothetical protein
MHYFDFDFDSCLRDELDLHVFDFRQNYIDNFHTTISNNFIDIHIHMYSIHAPNPNSLGLVSLGLFSIAMYMQNRLFCI